MRYAILLLVAGPLAGQDKADPAEQFASMTWFAGNWTGPWAAATGSVLWCIRSCGGRPSHPISFIAPRLSTLTVSA